ncbi:hypothetical protein AZI85_16055 [Bdellovibrio bacteriovorus]|uniref:NADP-dependent oxidoreductase domain-containing protein n=1 Tax=Bdellovibrio bacteriovorus TaxID=959 RepID=A0A150WU48_BDEBC|nr:hypothetical protein [Bdellovibrio bacteriovorus]KYG69906.1 hypothetical protein AZI85_16055 [Bdellovibrio bacteriovorus]
MVNKLVLGTMRLHEVTLDVSFWVQFFCEAHSLGVRKLHSSSEYESYPLLKEALSFLKKKHPHVEFEHIVKLAEPSFGDVGFEVGRLTKKVNDYLSDLQTAHLSVVQWMWRLNLNEDQIRIRDFIAACPCLAKEVEDLKLQNKIKQFMCFPYSVPFANSAIRIECIDGLVVYRNVIETEYDKSIELAAKLGKKSYILRPLAAGEALKNTNKTARELFEWALSHQGIEGAIISISKLEHIRDFASNS